MGERNPWLIEANLIDGHWVGADDGATIAVEDPATGAGIGTVPSVGRAEVARAIAAAEKALPIWSGKTAAERSVLMLAAVKVIRDNLEDLARLLTLEQGKPLAESRGEVAGSAAYLQWFAEEARRIYGDTIPSPWADRRIMVIKEPVGVIGAITPWNFPSSMIARKVGAALAAGCTAVVKPAALTPYSGLAWGRVFELAGLPAGAVNIVTGAAGPIGDELIENPVVRKITFTGSTEVGRRLAGRAAEALKRTSMELGGNAPFVVFDDADIDAAVAGALASKFRNSGQTCVCTNRIYVQSGIYDAFAKAFTAAVAAMKVGNGFDYGVMQGPVIDAKALRTVESFVADARAKGGRILTGGNRHALGACFFEPTVIADATPEMAFTREEIFGPVAPLYRFETEAEAVELANASEYGLAGYFYTRDLGRAFRVAEKLKFGQIGVNAGVITTEVAPFGGVKASGTGREGSKYGLEDYLDIKYVCIGGI